MFQFLGFHANQGCMSVCSSIRHKTQGHPEQIIFFFKYPTKHWHKSREYETDLCLVTCFDINLHLILRAAAIQFFCERPFRQPYKKGCMTF